MSNEEKEPEEPEQSSDELIAETPAAERKAPDELSVEEIRELQAISAEFRDVSQERDKLVARLQRVTADFHNSRKRMERELHTRIRYALEGFVKELLPVLDNFTRAMEHAESAREFDDLFEGIKLISEQWHTILERHGVRPIDSVGKRFDPLYHEAVSVAYEPDKPTDSVLEEAQKGYLLNDRVIRPAKVVVNKAPEEPKSSEEEEPEEEE